MPNIGQAMQVLFGNKSGATSGPPANPNQQPQNQRENQQQNAGGGNRQVGKLPDGSNSALESANVNQNNDGGESKEPVNPMDKFKDIWQPATDADGKPKASSKKSVMPKIDPAKIMEFASKQDFKKFVKPETLAAISKGGDEGMAAFAQAMQDIGSSTFASATTASAHMMQAALERQAADFEERSEERFKKFSLKENLGNKNPVLKHPAAQPIVEALQSVLSNKFPQASAQELQSTAEEFLTTFASSISGSGKKEGEEDTGGKGGRKQEDWSTFLPDFLK